MSSATLDDRDAGAGGRNRTRVGGVQVRCTTAVRRQPGSRMSESNRSRRCTGALSRRETSSGRSRGDRRALPGGLHRGRGWEPCQGSQVSWSATGGTRTRTGEAPLGISVRDVYQFRTTVAWCQRGDSNSHGDYAPTGSEPVTSTSSKHAGVVWAVGIEPTWSCSRSRRDNRCPTPRLRKMERARGVEPLSVCLEGRRLADRPDPQRRRERPAGIEPAPRRWQRRVLPLDHGRDGGTGESRTPGARGRAGVADQHLAAGAGRPFPFAAPRSGIEPLSLARQASCDPVASRGTSAALPLPAH